MFKMENESMNKFEVSLFTKLSFCPKNMVTKPIKDALLRFS